MDSCEYNVNNLLNGTVSVEKKVAMRATVAGLLVLVVFCAVLWLPIRRASAELPPQILVDKYLIHADQLHAAKDYAAAFDVMQKVVALQKEHSLAFPDDFHFKYAQVALSADSMHIALDSVTRYLAAAGKEGEFYKEALALMVEAEESQMSAEDTCTGKPEGALCWKEIDNHPKCYVWDDHFYSDQTVTWSGKCLGSKANGEGTLIWARGDEEHTETGGLERGNKRGRWVVRGDGGTSEGPFVDGKRNGQWVLRSSYGEVSEGVFVDGIKHGNWKYHDKDGRQSEGIYVNGRKHGPWVFRDWSGAISHESYKDGNKDGEFHGEYELCSRSDGSTSVSFRGTYAGGKKQGYWHNENSNDVGTNLGRWIGSGRYDEKGQRQGTWLFWLAWCGSHEPKRTGRYLGDFDDGNQHGRWVYYLFPAYPRLGTCYFDTYEHGKFVKSDRKKIKACRQMDW